MSKSPSTPPELMEAYKLLKAAERGPAARVLKSYLSKHPRDEIGWWLMAHAVTRPDNVRTCLERVLMLNPEHAKARAKLDALLPALDEPDDSFFGVSSADDPAHVSVPPASQGAQPFSSPLAFGATPLPSESAPAPDIGAQGRTADFAEALNEISPFTVPVDDAPLDAPEPGTPSTSPFMDAGGAGWPFDFEADAPENPFAAPAPAFDTPEAPTGTGNEAPSWLAQLDTRDVQDPRATGLLGASHPAAAKPDPADCLNADPAPPIPSDARRRADAANGSAALARLELAIADPFGAVDADEDPFADIPVDANAHAPDAGHDMPVKDRPGWLRRRGGGSDSG